MIDKPSNQRGTYPLLAKTWMYYKAVEQSVWPQTTLKLSLPESGQTSTNETIIIGVLRYNAGEVALHCSEGFESINHELGGGADSASIWAIIHQLPQGLTILRV